MTNKIQNQKTRASYSWHSFSFVDWHRGMTFIELSVVIAIMGIMSGVIFFNYGTFSSGIALQNTAQEVALTIQQAQQYATSGTTLGKDTTINRPTYGVFFNPTDQPRFSNAALDANKQFIIFNDYNPQDFLFSSNCSGDECVDNIEIESGDSISDICFDKKTAPPGDCWGGTNSALLPATVTFQRPFPNAHICSGDPCNMSHTDMEILLKSKNGNFKQVIIWQTGQISVENVE